MVRDLNLAYVLEPLCTLYIMHAQTCTHTCTNENFVGKRQKRRRAGRGHPPFVAGKMKILHLKD